MVALNGSGQAKSNFRKRKHQVEGLIPEKRKETVKLTTIRASITSLQVCRLVPLVTSKNSSLVVFRICKVSFTRYKFLSFILNCYTTTHFFLSHKHKTQSKLSQLLIKSFQIEYSYRVLDEATVKTKKKRVYCTLTLVFSLLVIGGNEITWPSASTRQG